MIRGERILLLSLLVLHQCYGPAGAFGETNAFDKQHQQALQDNPPGVVFSVSLKNSKAKFHPGEAITVELAFSSTLTNTYTLDAATYDRSGRLPSETWRLDPGILATDPLAEYFREGSFMGGGLRGMPSLTEAPHVITLELNEWLRLNRPGKYRLYDVSTRIIDERDPCAPHREMPVASNLIEFEILRPDRVWAAKELRSALETLDKQTNSEERHRAARVVRFLDTAEADRELVKRLGAADENCQFEYHIGLFSSTHRDLVLKEMERALAAPEYSVSEMFLQDLAHLKFSLAKSNPLPPYPATGNQAEAEQWRADFQARQNEQMRLQMKSWESLLHAIGHKRGPARAASLATLLNVGAGCAAELRPTDWTKESERLRTSLAQCFDLLASQTQSMLLEYRWAWVRTPALLPALRRLVEAEPGRPYDKRALHAVAMRRLNELSPDEGRKLILREIQNPRISSDATVLGELPDATLPELDDVLVQNLEKSRAEGFDQMCLCSHLVGRYASAAVLDRVKEVYGGPGQAWACDIQFPLVQYFLRVATDYGVEVVDKGLNVDSTGSGMVF